MNDTKLPSFYPQTVVSSKILEATAEPSDLLSPGRLIQEALLRYPDQPSKIQGVVQRAASINAPTVEVNIHFPWRLSDEELKKAMATPVMGTWFSINLVKSILTDQGRYILGFGHSRESFVLLSVLVTSHKDTDKGDTYIHYVASSNFDLGPTAKVILKTFTKPK